MTATLVWQRMNFNFIDTTTQIKSFAHPLLIPIGTLLIRGGSARGSGHFDNGGGVSIISGDAAHGTSGDLLIKSGSSNLASSGSIVISTSDAGSEGVSGVLSFRTGSSTSGDSGSIEISSGNAHSHPDPLWPEEVTGSSGNIHITVGTGDLGKGGNLKLAAGNTTGIPHPYGPNRPVEAIGGDVSIASGYSHESHSGEIMIETSNGGRLGNSGTLTLKTNDSDNGKAG